MSLRGLRDCEEQSEKKSKVAEVSRVVSKKLSSPSPGSSLYRRNGSLAHVTKGQRKIPCLAARVYTQTP